jgi:hypothetical protein
MSFSTVEVTVLELVSRKMKAIAIIGVCSMTLVVACSRHEAQEDLKPTAVDGEALARDYAVENLGFTEDSLARDYRVRIARPRAALSGRLCLPAKAGC